MTQNVIHGAVLISAFLIVWFLALFCLLPMGLGEVDAKTGAPVRPRLLFKIGIATGIAVVLWAVFYMLIATGILQL